MGADWREQAVRILSRLTAGDVLWFVDTGAPVFALTFDDGPHPDTTPGLLDVLARHRAHATFLLLGERVTAYGDLVERIVAEAHEIGNHTMRDQRSALLPPARFRADLAEADRLLRAYAPVRWFRPGSGFYTPWMLRAAAKLGLRTVLGTLAAGHRVDAGFTASIRPGSIVVLHEGTPNRRGVVATADRLLSTVPLRSVTLSALVSHG